MSRVGPQPSLFSSISGALSFSYLVLASLGLLFLTSGTGICLVQLGGHSLAKRRDRIVQFDTDFSALHQNSEQPRNSSFEDRRLNLRLSLVVFFQSCLLVVLFTGLVAEYGSNLTMQEWVNSSFSFGKILLTWQAVLSSSFMMGLLVGYSLIGRDLAL
jgi:hypothetical protein